MRIPKAFYGDFSTKHNGEIKNIPLGDNPPSNYIIQIIAFKNREVVAIFQIQVTGKEASALLPMPLPAVVLSSLIFAPPPCPSWLEKPPKSSFR